MGSPLITQILKRHSAALMSIDGVVGVGEGRMDDQPCVVVLLSKQEVADAVRSAVKAILPPSCPFRVDYSGEFYAR